MKKISLLFLLVIIPLIFSQFSCQSPTAPKGNTPPDTTSNNFTWQKYYFGVGGYTLLNDVAIVSDSDIWAVGSIYLDDSTGKPETAPHNAVHWDGKKWHLVKAPFYYQGKAFYSPIFSIYAFSDTNIWLESGIHWNGNQFQTEPLNIDFPSHVNKIWGTSSSNLYIVGNNGLIANRGTDGNWQKIESGTDMNIYDIWGAKNPNTGNEEILSVAFYPDTSAQRKIFQINGTSATEISSKGIDWDLHSIWFKPQSNYFVAGDGIYDKHILSDNTWDNQYYNATNYYINCIRGNDINDIVAVGSYGEVLHYNGVRWKSYRSETYLANGEYLSVAIKGNEIIAVGYDGAKAVIAVGKR